MKTILINKPDESEWRVKIGEELVIVVLATGSGEWRLRVRLVGRGAKCQILVVGVGQGEDKQRLRITTEHEVENTEAMIKVRGVAAASAKLKFDGLIKITKTGQQTNAFLEEKVVLLSDEAQHIAEPRLEIEAHEVRASHASTTCQLDETQIFYLMSRGLSRKKAKEMMVIGFLADVLKGVADGQRRDIIEQISKLVGELYA